MNVCVVSDNEYIYTQFLSMVKKGLFAGNEFDFYYSDTNFQFKSKYKDVDYVPINLQEKKEDFFNLYDLFLSLHSKQIFPPELVSKKLCINFHPGFNPYNRGWFPQVFSIINKYPVGVTIHKMDAELDHGPILFQREVPVYAWDTSYDVYKRIQDLEVMMIKDHLPQILCHEFKEIQLDFEGNINYKKDFLRLCEIDLNEICTFGEAIDRLRAMTFGHYRNAFFVTNEDCKVYVQIKLTPDPEK